ncbi:MAG: GNAT family N-acetyltransferase [Burkholderiales bacterium]|nr:MAG: GNAT family N-acetyltransferase [Burkholderiales bacterium]
MAEQFTTRRVDYSKPEDRAALTGLLDHYARDPMGGSTPIASKALSRLCDDLAQRPFAFSFIAYSTDGTAAGLVNCFEGYSTFKAAPLINIHDIVVQSDWRGQGVAQLLMQAVESEARIRKACKITLEVLTGNHTAMKSYERFGFAPYALDPKVGTATFMQKWL